MFLFLLTVNIMADTKFPIGKAPAKFLYVSNIADLGIEEQFFFSSLQGIVAQKEPRIFYIREKAPNEEFWQDYYLKKGYIKKFIAVKNPYKLLDMFKDEIKGAVIIDRDLPATINIATMVSGVYGYAVCTPEIAAKTGLPIKLDLRGMFKSNSEAYGWAMETFYKNLNQKVVCSLEPMHAGGWLRDYLIQHKIFTFWVQDSKADNLVGYSKYDEAFMQKILSERFPSNIPVIGFWHSGPYDQGLTEYGGLIFAGKSGKYSVVYDWATNTSVHSGIRVSYDKFKQKKAEPIKLDKTKNYVMLTQYESGDAPWYWQRLQYSDWQQQSRGTFAMNWCLGPLTLDLMPAILQWHYENATANDYFFCSMSGIGYTIVQYFAAGMPDEEEVRKVFLTDTADYMKRLNLSVVSLHADTWGAKSLSADSKYYKYYADNIPGLTGILSDFGRMNDLDISKANEFIPGTQIPVIHTLNQWNFEKDQSQELVKAIRENTQKDKPNFMSIMALSWTNKPDTIKAAIDKLGDDYIFVRADQMVDLLAQNKK